MRDFLKRMFGKPAGPVRTHATGPQPSIEYERKDTPADAPTPMISSAGQSAVSQRYFELSDLIQRAKQRGDFKAAIVAARDTFPLLKPFVAGCIREYGRWDIVLSHAVHTASTLMAVEEDLGAIGELRRALQAVRQLRGWLPIADEAEADCDIVRCLKAAIRERPGALQSEVRRYADIRDGRRASTLLYYLEQGGHIRRLRVGKTYQLYPADVPVPPHTRDEPHGEADGEARSLPPVLLADTVPVSWRGRSARQANVLDLKRLAVVRLPTAPLAWEARRERGASRRMTAAAPERGFTVTGKGWSVGEERRLASAERPDPAFRLSYPGRRWTYWLDRHGRTTRWPQHPSVLQVTDETGTIVSERGVPWDIHHASTNVEGSAIVALSRDGVLHGYTHALEPLLAARIRDLPEYQACAKRFELSDENLRNYVRCVAVSSDRDAYLVTMIDEAWCLSATGDVFWGLRFPTKDGWLPVTGPGGPVGSSAEIMQALTLLGVTLPADPENIGRAYRQRAMEWHPDRHPGDPSAVRRMQELNAAIALLRSTDESALSSSATRGTTMYEDVASRKTFTGPAGMTLTMGLRVSPLYAADWVYAAAIGDGRVYLAGYSGRVVEVAMDGHPLRAYDFGAPPYHIARTARYLYLLTSTRLFVLEEDRLVTLLDLFEEGEVMPADAGFGLLEKKRFRWFSPSGEIIGTIESRDPIRRVFCTTAGVVVESRQRRAVVQGTPPWW